MRRISEKIDKVTQNRISHLERVQTSCKEREEKAKKVRERKSLLNTQGLSECKTTFYDDVKYGVEGSTMNEPVTFSERPEIFTEPGVKVPTIVVSS